MDEPNQDVFISHAGADKPYVRPLADALASHEVTFWLDEIDISWGDSVVSKINDGFRTSQFVLLCLSENFMRRPWPEAEMTAVLAIQNTNGVKRVLPLILNSREQVFHQYPLLAGLAYREFSEGPNKIATEIAALTKSHGKIQKEAGEIAITVEGVHTGKLCRLRTPKRASVKWLASKAQAGLDVQNALPVGPFTEFRIRWVLVDVQAEAEWEELPRHIKRRTHAVVATQSGSKFAFSDRERLADLGVRDEIVFHLYAIEDEEYRPPVGAAP